MALRAYLRVVIYRLGPCVIKTRSETAPQPAAQLDLCGFTR
jgi:hypothetical protein